DVPRQRDRPARAHERGSLRALGGRDEIRGAALVVVTPAAPVVELLEVAFDAVLRGRLPVGHRQSFLVVRAAGRRGAGPAGRGAGGGGGGPAGRGAVMNR